MSGDNGTHLGSYRLEEVIGRGAMGQVWAGRDDAGRPVAVKTLHPHLAHDDDLVRRFVLERATLTSVAHPNVVAVRDLVAEGGSLGIVMELVDGTDLRHHLTRSGTLPPAEIAALGAAIGDGLAAIHTQGITHRDIKPENILLARAGDEPPTPKIADFGVSKITDAGPDGRAATVLTGTPDYMAPELVDGTGPAPHSDLYALGVLLYECACGVPPFRGRPPVAVIRAHVDEIPGRPDGIPDPLWTILTDLLAKDPADRPADAATLAQRLRDLAPEVADTPAAPQITTPPPTTPAPRPAHGVGGGSMPGYPPGGPLPGYPPGESLPGYPPGGSFPGYATGHGTGSFPGYAQPAAMAAPTGYAAPPPAPPRRRRPVVLGAILALLLAGGVTAGVLLAGRDGDDSAKANAAASTPASPTARPTVTQWVSPDADPAQQQAAVSQEQPAPAAQTYAVTVTGTGTLGVGDQGYVSVRTRPHSSAGRVSTWYEGSSHTVACWVWGQSVSSSRLSRAASSKWVRTPDGSYAAAFYLYGVDGVPAC